MNVPSDPFMLLSFVNTKLRDEYTSLEEMCKSLDVNKDDLIERLEKAGFEYIAEINQFR